MTIAHRLWFEDLDGAGTQGWEDILSDAQFPHGLFYGTVQPGPTNTGCSQSILDAYAAGGSALAAIAWNSSSVNDVTLSDGALIENKVIYGDIKPPAANASDIIIRNCLLVGGANTRTSEGGVVNCAITTRTGTGKVKLYNCTILPRLPTDGRDCIRGRRWEAYSCDMSGGVDGMGIFSPPSQGGSCDVVAMGNWVHDLCYQNPDMAHAGTTAPGTHNDVVQHQGGINVTLKGNFFQGTLGYVNGTPPSDQVARVTAGYCHNGIIIQDNNGAGTDNSIIVEDNWFTGAINHTNIKAGMTCVFQNNKHYADHYTGGHYIWAGTTATVTGITTTNKWASGPNVGNTMTTGNGGVEFF